MEDDNKLILERKKKLDRIKEKFNPYPNTFKKTDDSILLVEKYKDIEKDDLKNKNVSVSIAGRLLMIREMGNSTFADLSLPLKSFPKFYNLLSHIFHKKKN